VRLFFAPLSSFRRGVGGEAILCSPLLFSGEGSGVRLFFAPLSFFGEGSGVRLFFPPLSLGRGVGGEAIFSD